MSTACRLALAALVPLLSSGFEVGLDYARPTLDTPRHFNNTTQR
jgi:hypothetical protein